MNKLQKFLPLFYGLIFIYFAFIANDFKSRIFILILSIFIMAINFFIASDKKIEPEKKFGIIALILGLLLIFFVPVLHGIDEGAHFFKVYSFFYDLPNSKINEEDLEDAVPASIILADSIEKFSDSEKLNGIKIDESNIIYTQDYIGAKLYSPVSYITFLLPMFLFKYIINLNIYWVIILGRIFSFLSWVLISFYTIKIMPKRKEFMAFLCLMPMSLSLVSTFTGDLLTNVAVFLFIAIWYRLYEEKRPIKSYEYFLIAILGILSCFAKIVYALIFLIIFLLPKECFKNNKHKLFSCISIVLFLILAFIFNFMFVGTDLLEFYPTINEQKDYIFEHPFKYFSSFLYTVLINFPDYIFQFTTGQRTLGHNAVHINDFISFLYLAILILSLFLDKNEIKTSKKAKILIFTICFLVIFIIHTSLYLQYTSSFGLIGHPYIIGVQGRYFIPLAVLAIFVNAKNNLKINNNNLWTLVILINFIILLKISGVFLI